MRAISIRQPFAEQILQGKKKIEWRGTNSRIRERLYVYASKGKIEDPAEWRKVGKAPGSLPTGVMVGTVEIVDATFDEDEYLYAWHLARPERLTRPLLPVNQPQPVIWRPKFASRQGLEPTLTSEPAKASVAEPGSGLTGELVCYHNPDTMGTEAWDIGLDGDFGAVSARRYDGAEGTRVWFVTGRGSPRRYYLAGWFIVETVETEEYEPGVSDHFYRGTRGEVGRNLSAFVEIGKGRWFKELRRACANFATLQHVRDRSLLAELERAWNHRPPPR